MYVELSCSRTPLCLGASTVGVAPRLRGPGEGGLIIKELLTQTKGQDSKQCGKITTRRSTFRTTLPEKLRTLSRQDCTERKACLKRGKEGQISINKQFREFYKNLYKW